MELYIDDQKIICGVDEAGRGSLSGPVVAAAVIIPKNAKINLQINDSKKISAKKRESLYHFIKQEYIWSIGQASAQEIDEINILQATKLAIKRAISALEAKAEIVIIDGNMTFHEEYLSIIKGDQKFLQIAAASIVAKCFRDNLIIEMSEQNPHYFWNKNKGYGTKEHFKAIESFGLSIHHRKSFLTKLIYL